MAEKTFWVFYDSLSKTQSNPIATYEAQTSILKMGPQQIERFFIWTTGWNSWQQLKTYLESDQKNFVSTFTVPLSKATEATEVTVKAVIKEVLENTQTQTSYKNKKEDTKSFSSIHLEEETISRIVKQEENAQAKKFDGDEINWSNIQKPTLDFSRIVKKSMNGRESRLELKIEILLISPKGKTFRTRSKNISLSGSLLEDTIPFDYYGTTFDVVVINMHTQDLQNSRVKLSASAVGNNGGLTQRIHYSNVSENQKKALKMLLEDYLNHHKKSKKAS